MGGLPKDEESAREMALAMGWEPLELAPIIDQINADVRALATAYAWHTPALSVREAAAQLAEAKDRLQLAVDRARERGETWTDIGAELGMKKQSAWEKFGKGQST